MDELTLLDSTLPPAAGPTADVAAAGRNALLHEARRPVPPPRRTTTRRVVLTGALAASLAGAFTVAQNVGGSSSPGVIPGAAVANAAELGSAAAAAAEREPWRTPRPDQWVYQRTRNAAGGFDMNRSWEGVDPAHTNDVSDWSRVDGKGIAYFDRNGKLQTVIDRPGDGVETSGGPMWSVQNYATLPTEREALLATLKTPYPNQISEPSDASVYSTISAMLDDPMPPKLRAALFRLLPTLDGVVLRRGVTDQIGRRGVAFELLDRNERTQIILDPSSYRFLGSRIVVVRDYQRHGDAGVHKAGTTVQSSAVVASRIVDRAGDTR